MAQFRNRQSAYCVSVSAVVRVSGRITYHVALICPILHGNLVKGFHTSRTDLDVPGKNIFPG